MKPLDEKDKYYALLSPILSTLTFFMLSELITMLAIFLTPFVILPIFSLRCKASYIKTIVVRNKNTIKSLLYVIATQLIEFSIVIIIDLLVTKGEATEICFNGCSTISFTNRLMEASIIPGISTVLSLCVTIVNCRLEKKSRTK